MAWWKGDDKSHGAPAENRAWAASRASLGLHYLASSYVADYLTDGFVDATFVEQKLPAPKERDAAIAALVDAGLWQECHLDGAAGWEIVGWLDRNPSKAQVEDRRVKRAAAGAAGARGRWNGRG